MAGLYISGVEPSGFVNRQLVSLLFCTKVKSFIDCILFMDGFQTFCLAWRLNVIRISPVRGIACVFLTARRWWTTFCLQQLSSAHHHVPYSGIGCIHNTAGSILILSPSVLRLVSQAVSVATFRNVTGWLTALSPFIPTARGSTSIYLYLRDKGRPVRLPLWRQMKRVICVRLC
jgi:hypothetical protein